MTVQYRGEEKTLKQMAVYQKDPDRAVREETWRLTISRVAEDADQLDALFDEMRALRMQIARNAGFDNYRDYSHQSKGRSPIRRRISFSSTTPWKRPWCPL
jgi:oligoendopeptidase F